MITIPEIHKQELEKVKENGIVDFTDYFIGQFLEASPTSAFAEQKEGKNEIQWVLSDSAVTVPSIPKRYFRTFLARIGHYYMSDQLYGGYQQLIVEYRKKSYQLEITMKNQSAFSVKIETQSANQSSRDNG